MGSKRSSSGFGGPRTSCCSTSSKISFYDRHFGFSPDKTPKLIHALIVIFLEFFAWGLLTMPMISVLSKTFPDQTFLHNGVIMGIKGILSFLSAPMIGGMSDIWGRKPFLVITVFFTCLPIPFISVNSYLYFILVAFSGLFSVTFSVVFAYVADVTNEQNRSWAYGAVSATFAFSLVISPAAGSFLSWAYSDNFVVALAALISLADVAFIVLCIPESLPEKLRMKSYSFCKTADPFSALRQAGKDPLILRLVFAVLLSYLPEAGQYSCFFIYLKLVIGFSSYEVALFIALVGLMSIFAQTVFLSYLIRRFGAKNAITIGLIFEMLQLICYGLGSDLWVIWGAAIIAAASSITYPAISAYVSNYADDDKQGLVQGMITGVRGLCTGIGPAMFGIVFYFFGVDLNSEEPNLPMDARNLTDDFPAHLYNFLNSTIRLHHQPFPTTDKLIPGPPFLVGAVLVLFAIMVMAFIPEVITYLPNSSNFSENHKSGAKIGSMASPVNGSGQVSRNSSTTHQDYYYKSVQQQNLSDCEAKGDPDMPNLKILSSGGASSTEHHMADVELNQDEDSMLYMIQPSTSCTISDSDSSSDSDIHSPSSHNHRSSHDILSSPTSAAALKLTRSSSCKNRTSPAKESSALSRSDANISVQSPHTQSTNSLRSSQHQVRLFNPPSLRPIGI